MAVKGFTAIRSFDYAPEAAENEGETPKPRRLLSFGLTKKTARKTAPRSIRPIFKENKIHG
jgi:hypothetical protein